jgi:hypothetical protein
MAAIRCGEHRVGAVASALRSLGERGEDGLLRVQTVLGLVEHDRLLRLEDFGGDFLAGVGGQAVPEERIGLASFMSWLFT